MSPTGLTVLVVVLVLTASAAGAATGAALILGRSNAAGETTRLTNTGRGPALKLSSGRRAAPLSVDGNRNMVANLNADLLDGLHRSAFRNVFVAGDPQDYDGGSRPQVSQIYVVPKGVTDVHFRLQGGGGPGGYASGGGQGAYLEVVAGVTPGHRLRLQPGTGGVAAEAGDPSDGTAATVTNETTGARLVAGGGKAGSDCDDPGAGGKVNPRQDWKYDTVIVARDGEPGDTCVEDPYGVPQASGGGPDGVAGSGGYNNQLRSSGASGYIVAIPMRGHRPDR